MAGRIAITVPRGSGRAGFSEAPRSSEPPSDAARQQQRMRLRRRAKFRQCGLVETEQQLLGLTGIGDGATEEIRRCAGHREQRRGDQAAGRGFGNSDGFAARLKPRGDRLGKWHQIVHVINSGYSIKSSVTNSTSRLIVSPNSRAVFRLMTSSNLVGR